MTVNTKIIRLDEDTRRVMRMCSIRQADAHWTLDLPQLDRKDYEKAKKALTALGCIWNRKAGTHICNDDPTASITGIANGEDLTVEQYDFFPTPTELVTRMVDLADLKKYSQLLLEPSAGDGRIAEEMQKRGYQHSVYCCEVNPAARDILEAKGFRLVGADFLEYEIEHYKSGERMFEYDRIVMKPPFSKEQDILHVQHAYGLLAAGGRIVAIMSEHAWVANNARCMQFREWLDEVGWSEELPEGTFKESGTMIRTRLVVIDHVAKGADGRSVQMRLL